MNNNKSRRLYPKLAAENIRKNAKTYIPYIITCVLTIAMFYIICSISGNEGLHEMARGSSIMPQILSFGTVTVGIFAAVFLFYTNSFLMKKRKKEFGLYNILGMEKRHIAKVVSFETLYVSLLGIILGLASGIVLDKAMHLLIAKLIGTEVPLGFYVSVQSAIAALLLFGAIFILILLNSLRQIHISKPIELLKGGNMGEKEPKTKWLMTLLGAACLGTGYAIALTVKNIAEAIGFFFFAVILVIIGTYFLFTAGSIFILKMLRKNKGYYYKTKHFISVSGMIYRMKQNAVGLANICILSTMVLVMISSTTSLIFGIEDIIKLQNPSDITLTARRIYRDGSEQGAADAEAAAQIMEGFSDCTEKTGDYITLSFNCYKKDNMLFEGDGDEYVSCQFITEEAHNKYSGDSITLNENQIFVSVSSSAYEPDSFTTDFFNYPTLNVMGEEYEITETVSGSPSVDYASRLLIIVKDTDVLKKINDSYAREIGAEDNVCFLGRILQYNITDISRKDEVLNALYEKSGSVSVNDRYTQRDGLMGIYGGLFFLGIFLGTLFVMATILIIYYKQISEGYDDKGRFDIMQKVGMTKSEVKGSIRSQVLCVFFLPLIAAGVHMCFAFPIVSKMLRGLGLMNTGLYIVCTLGSFLVFAAMYVLIYSITAKMYYRIVSR